MFVLQKFQANICLTPEEHRTNILREPYTCSSGDLAEVVMRSGNLSRALINRAVCMSTKTSEGCQPLQNLDHQSISYEDSFGHLW